MEINQKAIEFMKRLISFDTAESEPTEGAPFGKKIRECLDYALSEMSGCGFTVKNGDGYYGYGEIGDGELFGVLCHLDVVPKGDGWHYKPFGAEEKDGRIYGRGALDDKGPFAACFYAAVRLLEEGYRPAKRLRFILGCDEESGWKCMDKYCECEEMPKAGFSPDGDFPVINCEKGIVYHTLEIPLPSGVKCFRAGERANMVPNYAEIIFEEGKIGELDKNGISYIRSEEGIVVSAEGVSAHGSHPEVGDNAITKLLAKIAPVDGNFATLYEKFSAYDGSNVGLKLYDGESGGLTLNLGCARTEGQKIVFELDIRHPISYKKDEITDILKAELPKIAVEQGFYHLPLYVSKENELVKTLLSAYNKVTGENAEPVSIGGGTYARVLPLGVAFGPCFPGGNSGMHCADEYMDKNDFAKMSEIYYEALKNLCFVK